MRINKPKKWDRKWRIILFDIPEKIRKARDVFRYHLNQLGFYEFQKSVFVHPYNCKDEIDYLIEFIYIYFSGIYFFNFYTENSTHFGYLEL